MKKRKLANKIISSALVLAMGMACLSGCGESPDMPVAPAPEASSEKEEPAALPEAEPATEIVKSDVLDISKTYEQQGWESPEIGTKTDDGYTLIWKDDFSGDSLDLTNWNYEYHEPGWVNNEWQSYGDSKDNTFLENGALIIQALKEEKADGSASYTSGRVNTQNKQAYTYGKWEIRANVPVGKGFLPAIWMMPNDENLYGQWPKCGEVDIMEVLGDNVSTNYSTLHYGEPHSSGQKAFKLSMGNFHSEYHVFSVEWEPGEFRFYVDDILYHTENDWYTKKEGFDEITYPAPFDQPFYLILNVAVGGDWPGYPDEDAKFGTNARMCVDYVRFYQKDSYDENVTKPVKEVNFRGPDENGNYVINPNFDDEDVYDSKNWFFLTAGEGVAECSIKDNAVHIDTTNPGELDYSVQLVQPDIPMEKGSSYTYSFDAWADNERTIITAITAPNAGWVRYLPDTYITVTPDKQTYTFDILMTDETDPTARIEYNLGNQGYSDSVHITNVRFEKSGEGGEIAKDPCLPDGNYVRNGDFDRGEGRMIYWNVSDGADYRVTNDNNIRMFAVDGANKNPEDIVLYQEDICLSPNTEYAFSFSASGLNTITASILGETFEASLSDKMTDYSFNFTTGDDVSDGVLSFNLGNGSDVRLDNVRIMEDSILLNGSFNSGFTGYELYAYTTSDVAYVIDTLNEDSACCIDIMNTGDLDWKIQLKQNDITLTEGKNYRLSFDAKSTVPRRIMFALQRDGSADDNWIPYSGSCFGDATEEYNTYSVEFTMENPTDEHTILSISLGAVDGIQISDKHTVVIDNILLEELD